MGHDSVAHARDFAERYAEPINYHVENRMKESAIPTDRIGGGETAIRTVPSDPRRRPAAATCPDDDSLPIPACSTLS